MSAQDPADSPARELVKTLPLARAVPHRPQPVDERLCIDAASIGYAVAALGDDKA